MLKHKNYILKYCLYCKHKVIIEGAVCCEHFKIGENFGVDNFITTLCKSKRYFVRDDGRTKSQI